MNFNPFESPGKKLDEPVDTREALVAQLSLLRPRYAELMRILKSADEQFDGKVLSIPETQARVRAQNLLLTEMQALAKQIDGIENKLIDLPPTSSDETVVKSTNDIWSDPGYRGGDNRSANS